MGCTTSRQCGGCARSSRPSARGQWRGRARGTQTAAHGLGPSEGAPARGHRAAHGVGRVAGCKVFLSECSLSTMTVPRPSPRLPLSWCPEHLKCGSLGTFFAPGTEPRGSQGIYFPIISASKEGHPGHSLASPPGRRGRWQALSGSRPAPAGGISFSLPRLPSLRNFGGFIRGLHIHPSSESAASRSLPADEESRKQSGPAVSAADSPRTRCSFPKGAVISAGCHGDAPAWPLCAPPGPTAAAALAYIQALVSRKQTAVCARLSELLAPSPRGDGQPEMGASRGTAAACRGCKTRTGISEHLRLFPCIDLGGGFSAPGLQKCFSQNPKVVCLLGRN